MDNPDNHGDRLDEVSQNFLRRLPARIELIAGLWKNYQDEGEPDTLATFHAEVHKLKGTAATYRYLSLAAALADIESALVDSRGGGIFKAASLSGNIESRVAALRSGDWHAEGLPGSPG